MTSSVGSVVSPVGTWASGPQRSQAGLDAGGVADGRVADQRHRMLGDPASRDLGLGGRHLRTGPAQVLRAGAAHLRIAPRHRAGQHEVDLRGGVAVPEAPQRVLEGPGQSVREDVRRGAGGRVQQHRSRRRDIAPGAHVVTGDDLAAMGAQVGDEGVDDRLRAADGDRPAGAVRQGAQQCGRWRRGRGTEDPRSRGRRPRSGGRARSVRKGRFQAAVPCRPSRAPNIGAAARVRGLSSADGTDRLSPRDSSTTRSQWAARVPRVARQAAASAPRPAAVRSTSRQAIAAGFVQGLGVGRLGGAQLHPSGPHVEGTEERARQGERLHGRADVMGDAGGEAEIQGAGAAADRVLRLQHLHPQPGAGEGDGGGEAVGPRADDDGIELGEPLCTHVASLDVVIREPAETSRDQQRPADEIPAAVH